MFSRRGYVSIILTRTYLSMAKILDSQLEHMYTADMRTEGTTKYSRPYVYPRGSVQYHPFKARSNGTAVRERMLLEIVNYKREHDGISPTVRELAASCEISSTSVTKYHLSVLVLEGKITMQFAEARSIQVVGGLWMTQRDLEARLKEEREAIRVLRQPA